MASGTRRKSASTPSRLVFSDVHIGTPCSECFLRKENQAVYTHPAKWKNQAMLAFVQAIEPDIKAEACICRNCRDNIAGGYKDPLNYHPRWLRQSRIASMLCEVPHCDALACRTTKLGTRELLSKT